MHKLTAELCQEYVDAGHELAQSRPLSKFEADSIRAFEIARDQLKVREALERIALAFKEDNASPFAEGSARLVRKIL